MPTILQTMAAIQATKRTRLDDWESNVLPSVPLLTWAILRTPSLGKAFQ